MMYQEVIPYTNRERETYIAFTPHRLRAEGPAVSVEAGKIQFEIARMVIGQPYRAVLDGKEYFLIKRDAKRVDIFWNKG